VAPRDASRQKVTGSSPRYRRPLEGASPQSNNYFNSILANQPLIYFRLDESGGSVANDSSGNNQTGSYGPGTLFNVPGALLSDSDAAISSGSVTQSGTILPTGGADRTFEFWVQNGNLRDWSVTSGDQSTHPFNLVFSYTSWGSTCIDLQADTNAVLCGPISLADGKWHLIDVTFKAGTVAGYVDGQVISTASLTVNTAAGFPLVMSLGTSSGSPGLDEAAFYGTALSAANIDVHWTFGGSSSGVKCTTPSTSSTYAQGVLADRPVLYLRLGDLVTDPTDRVAFDSASTTNCANGAYAPNVVANPSGALLGDPDGAVTGGTITQGGTTLPTGGADRTFELWVHNGDLRDWSVTSGDQAAHPFNVLFSPGTWGTYCFDVHADTDALLCGSIDLNTRTWHLIDVTFKAGAVTGYVDGQVIGTASLTVNTAGGSPLVINTGTSNGSPSFDEAAFYNYALDAQQIAIRGTGGVPIPLTPEQTIGGGSFCLPCFLKHLEQGISSVFRPVNTSTGEFYHSWNDLSVPGRGLFLAFSRTYSSQLASQDGPVGFGWTGSYNVFASIDSSSGDVTVHEENGSEVTFTPDGQGGFIAPTNVLATLTFDGTFYTFQRDQSRVQYVFDASGLLQSETDRNGYTTTFVYTGPQLTSVTDPAGRELLFTYDPNGHIVLVNDVAGGRSVQFTYDGAGNLATATDVKNGVWQFTYDPNHLMLTMTDPRGGVTTNAYDTSNRVVTQTDSMNRVTQFAYTDDGQGRLITVVTSPMENQTQYVYQNLLLASVTRGFGTADAATTTYTYDPLTLAPSAVTDPNGHTSFATYDAQGNLLTRTDALDRTTTYTYDSTNDVLTVTDPKGVTTTNTYDSNGNLTSTTAPLGSGKVIRTSYAYDPANPGDLVKMMDPDANAWRYAYDADGNRVTAFDPAADETSFAYDAIGRMTSLSTPDGNVWKYAYDNFGDRLTTTDPLGNIGPTNTYDQDRNLVQVADANGDITRYVYDLDNERVKQVRADSGGHILQTLQTTFDRDGNIASQIDGKGNVTSYTYDALDRRITLTDALSRITSYNYDPASNLKTLIDPSGRTTTYTYDAASELTGIDYSDPKTPDVSFRFDSDGQRIGMTDGTGVSTYTYDNAHRLVRAKDGSHHLVRYGYDGRSLITKLGYPGGKMVSRTYDQAGRLHSVADWLGHRTTFGYDGDSNLTTETYPNGVVGTFSYDRADRLASIDDSTGSTQLLHLDYTRDRLGLIGTEGTRAFGYDGMNRLTSDSDPTQFTYDSADELTHIAVQGEAPQTLTYDQANELIKLTQGTASTSYGYDAQGNRLTETPSAGSPTTYTWDQANRLVGFDNGTHKATYRYNGEGLRVVKVIDQGSPDNFVWDLAEGLPIILSDGTSQYVTGPGGLPLEQVAGTVVLYYHQDQLGSTRLLTDAAGAQAGTAVYTAYGLVKNSSGASSPFGFAGQYTDSESSLEYVRARFYQPATGQFLSRDPWVLTTGLPYAYTPGDPVNLRDPSGLHIPYEDEGLGPEGPPAPCIVMGPPAPGETSCPAPSPTLGPSPSEPNQFSQTVCTPDHSVCFPVPVNTRGIQCVPGRGCYFWDSVTSCSNPLVPVAVSQAPQEPPQQSWRYCTLFYCSPPQTGRLYTCGQILDMPQYCVAPPGTDPPDYTEHPDEPANLPPAGSNFGYD